MRQTSSLIVLLLATAGSYAHETKPYDANGGHWDESGYYHCHINGCIQAPNRYEHRLRAFSSQREMENLYLKEDWPYPVALNGCKTSRTVALESSSKTSVTYTNPRNCEIREGLWVDEYTGEEYPRAAMMETDHIISPQYANSSNGYTWDYSTRVQFANDPLNLVVVSRESARKKNGRGIGMWQPRKEFQCEYAQNWKDIAERYKLDLFASDQSQINTILKNCGEKKAPAVEAPKK